MNLQALDHQMRILFKNETAALTAVLEHIQRCEKYKLHLELGYGSLFSYLTQSIGYSEGAAQRRIDAARLMKEVPEVKEKLKSGEISLAQTSMVQKAARRSGNRLIKAEALKSIEKKSQRESEKIVSQLFDLPVDEETKTKHQKNESVRIEVTLSKEQYEKLEKVKAELSHIVPDGNLPEVLDYMMTRLLAATVAVNPTSTPKTNRTLTPKTRRQILKRDQCCTFVSSITGRKCENTWKLQVDHVHPKWAGGTHDSRNLRGYCAAHNQHRYQKESGLVAQWIEPVTPKGFRHPI